MTNDNTSTTQHLELHIADSEVQSSTVTVSWCVSPEVLKEFKDSGKIGYVLLTVVPKDSWFDPNKRFREKSIVVPLSSLMSFVSIYFPGDNYIVGSILAGDTAAHYQYSTIFIRNYEMNPGDYLKRLDEKPILREGITNCLIQRASDTILINVPKEVFAPPPAEWEKKWVNHYFHDKVGDQCDFWRRRLFAYSLQPLWVAFMVLVRFIVATFAVAVGQSVAPTVIYSVFSYSYEDLLLARRWAVLPRVESEWKHIGSIFSPALWLLYIAISISVGNWWEVPLYALVTTVSLAVVVVIGLSIAQIQQSELIMNKLNAYMNRIEHQRMEESEKALTCNGQVVRSIKDIPRHSRTIKLRLADLKAKVCRPYAK